jgi:hypothetical protein
MVGLDTNYYVYEKMAYKLLWRIIARIQLVFVVVRRRRRPALYDVYPTGSPSYVDCLARDGIY